MKLLIKFGKNFTLLPLFFQVFALACSLMFVVAVYGFVTESFREARIFLYSGLTGFFVFALLNLAISNRTLKETGLIQIVSLILLFLLLPLFLALPAWIILPSINFLDAYLDMVGALTTTGLQVFEQDILTTEQDILVGIGTNQTILNSNTTKLQVIDNNTKLIPGII